jgi:uncharacterized protein (PEP-CTERM system associated)
VHRRGWFDRTLLILGAAAIAHAVPAAGQQVGAPVGVPTGTVPVPPAPETLPPLPQSGFGVPSVNVPANAVGTPPAVAPVEAPSLRLPTPGAGIVPIQSTQPTAPAVLIQPRATLGEAFTDNVRQLSSPRTADAETRLMPGISISADTPRLQGVLTGNFEYDKYAVASDFDNYSVNGFAKGLGIVVPDKLFIDAAAVATQASRLGAAGFAPIQQLPRSQLSQVYTANFSPYLRQSYRDLVDTELRYRFSGTIVNKNTSLGVTPTSPTALPSLSNSTFNEGTLTAATGARFERLLSKLTIDASSLDSKSQIANTRTTAYDDAEYRFTPAIAALARLGYENIHYPAVPLATTNGVLWSVGGRVALGPGDQYAIVNYGKQQGIYGLTGAVRYEVTPTTVLTASATKGTQSPQELLNNTLQSSNLDAYGRIVDQYNLPTAFANPEFALQNDVFRQREYRVGASTVIDVNRIFFFAFYTSRTSLSSASPPSKSLGANLTWSRDLHEDLTGSLSLGYAHVSHLTLFNLIGPGPTTLTLNGDTASTSLGLSYLFSPTLTGSATYYFTYQTGVSGASGPPASKLNNVLVNRLEFLLTKSF